MTDCNLCGSSENEYLYAKDGFDIVKCKRCGLVFVKDQPSSSELQNKYYNKDYYTGEVYNDYNLSDSIEHLKDPKEALLKANKFMKNGGLIVISTGDINSIDAKISGDKWDLLAPPHHLYYFSINTLRQLLDRTGFSVVKIIKREGNVLSPMVFEKIIGNRCLNYLNQIFLKIIKRDMITILNYPLVRLLGGI